MKWIQSAFTLVVVLTATFFLLRLAPGGPFDAERVWPAQVRENLNTVYGLDQPLAVQWARWMKNMATGDWGESLHYQGQRVWDIVVTALRPSLVIGVLALVLAFGLGVGLALLRGAWRVPVVATLLDALAAIGLSVPAFFLASLGMWVLGVYCQWLPVALVESPLGYVLPVVVTAVRPAAWIYQLMDEGLREQWDQPYIRYALAKGLSPRAVVFKHAAKNACMGVLGVSGPLGANLLTGSFVVEWVFQIPGLGKHFVTSVLNRDYPLVMGVTLTYGVALLALNRMSEMAMQRIDPRVAP